MTTYTLPFAPPVGNELHCLDTDEWKADCMKYRGKVLIGKESHWCYEWDGAPVDETTPEWPCGCAKPEIS